MSIAGAVALVIGLTAAVLVVVALLRGEDGTLSGYICFGLVAVVFSFVGVAMLSGARVMPDHWPPRDDDPPGAGN